MIPLVFFYFSVNIGPKAGKQVKSGKAFSGKQTLRFPRSGGPARIEDAVSYYMVTKKSYSQTNYLQINVRINRT
jgi:hypothetical protein